MPLNKKQKVFAYGTGFALGCLLMVALPLPKLEKKERPWQTDPAPYGYYPLTWKDAYGHTVTLEEKPWRIVSLAPSVTEILFAMGLGDRVAGRTRWCRYPPEAAALTDVGNLNAPDREIIAQLYPHLVLGTVLTEARVYRQIETLHTPAAAFSHKNLDGVLHDIAQIGKITAEPGAAVELVRKIEARRDAIQQVVATHREAHPAPPLRTVILYELASLYSAGKDTWPGDMIELCGARNLAADAPSPWPKLSLEALIQADPEVIFLIEPPQKKQRDALLRKVQALAEGPLWKNVSAVREGRIHYLDQDVLNIPGPRMVDALADIAKGLYPDAFAEQPDTE